MQVEDYAFIVGVVGDAILQILVQTPYGEKWGLNKYFQLHGPIASLLIAGGMMYLFVGVFRLSFGSTPSYALTFLYGMMLDVIFRITRIMPSLDGYYEALTPIMSMIWGGIPAVIPFFLFNTTQV